MDNRRENLLRLLPDCVVQNRMDNSENTQVAILGMYGMRNKAIITCINIGKMLDVIKNRNVENLNPYLILPKCRSLKLRTIDFHLMRE